MKLAAIALALPLALALAACSKKDVPATDAKQYGEPVGMRLSGNAGDPTYEIAFAVDKGVAGPAPSDMAGPVYVAAKSCAGVRDVTHDGQTLRVKMQLVNGSLSAPKPLPDDPAAACLLKALDGKSIVKTAAPQTLDVRIELRAPEKAS